MRSASSQGTLPSVSLAFSSRSACCAPRMIADSSTASASVVATSFAATAASAESSFALASASSAFAAVAVDVAAVE